MESIKKYVEKFFRTTKKNSRYEMSFSELESVVNEFICAKSVNEIFPIINTLFNFGYAKGYRAALRKMKKKSRTT